MKKSRTKKATDLGGLLDELQVAFILQSDVPLVPATSTGATNSVSFEKGPNPYRSAE